MKPFYDFGCKYSETYKEECKNCGKTIEIATQKDNCPEYYTMICVKCDCGASVYFYLPVN